LVLTFGLGASAKADSVEVQWPSGHTDKLSNVAGGQTVTVQEAKGVTAARPYTKPSPAVSRMQARR
jgi:enediyne biosynthesis protein E4